MLQSSLRLRFVKVHKLPAYAIAVYADNALLDICFHGSRAAKQIHEFDRNMQAALNLSNMDSYEREILLRPVLEFCEHIKQVRVDLSMIVAARLLTDSPQCGFQQIWDSHRDKDFWEQSIIHDYELPLVFDARRDALVDAGVSLTPDSSRVRIRLPDRAQRFQKVAQLLRDGAAQAPSSRTSILGFDPEKPGGYRQEPEPMSREEWEYLMRTGVVPGERDWEDPVKRALRAKIDDPL